MDIAAFVVSVVSVIAAIGSAVGAILAVQQSKEANSLSKKANRVAKDSAVSAEKANSLAAEANKIAGDANAIAERALHATADDVAYSWRLEFDYDSSTLTVINDCPSTARDAAAFIRIENETVVESGAHDYPAFGKFSFECPLLVEKVKKAFA